MVAVYNVALILHAFRLLSAELTLVFDGNLLTFLNGSDVFFFFFLLESSFYLLGSSDMIGVS